MKKRGGKGGGELKRQYVEKGNTLAKTNEELKNESLLE